MPIPENANLKVKPFKVAFSESSLEDLKALLKISKLPPPTYEGTQSNLGITRKWMEEAKARWQEGFDWRSQEKEINEFPQWTATIKDDDGEEYAIHFVGLFSEKKDAIPIVLLHGWPGSFLEFLPLLPFLAASTSPAFHIIVPSLPGYAFSSPPPVHKDFGVNDAARLIHKLLIGLGFGAGYVAQGGDIGSIIARILAVKYDAAKIIHVNFCHMTQQDAEDSNFNYTDLTDAEKVLVARRQWYNTEEYAYLLEQSYRTSTISFIVASNHLALLAWVGEKFLLWTDEDPPLDTILEIMTLWWITETFPRSIYPYREMFTGPPLHSNPLLHLKKPFGHSNFPKELLPMPRSWVATTGNLVWYRSHDNGGHFAALEVPQILANDIVDFVKATWKEYD